MSKRLSQALFVAWLALQPAPLWTLLGVFGGEHMLRLALTEDGVDLVLSHDDPAATHHIHRHAAIDHLVASDPDVAGRDEHVIRRFPGELTIPARAMAPVISPAIGGHALRADPCRRPLLRGDRLVRDGGESGYFPLRL